MMGSEGILILSHCGFSFVEDLIKAVNDRGLKQYILSSKPMPEHGELRLQSLREKATIVVSTHEHELTKSDIDEFLKYLKQNHLEIKSCISVWEGYRGLMAYANERLGVSDLKESQINLLRNKLYVRNTLFDKALTNIRAYELTPSVLEVLKQSGNEYFVKPIQGIASYGAFPLRTSTQWSDLENIIAQAQEDTVYTSAFGNKVSFLAEDYLAGTEFSFEILVAESDVYVVGIHEKCQITELEGTVLEDSCTSPPISISSKVITSGIHWIQSLLSALDLNWGCFHIEVRYDGFKWDLIEINPRVGGSFISQSVQALNGQYSVLELWLELLLAYSKGQTENKKQEFIQLLDQYSYSPDGIAPTDKATFFRVYFAHSGKIENIEIQSFSRNPSITQVLLKAGDEVSDVSRETFLGQILWVMTVDERNNEIETLLRESDSAFVVHYKTEQNIGSVIHG